MSDELRAYIDDLKSRLPISEAIRDFVAGGLKLKGDGHFGICPFHNEKTPSFHVNDDRGSYFCFGCGAGGDVIDFFQRRDGLSFMDALEVVRQRAGLPAYDGATRSDPARESKAAHAKPLEEAQRFYHSHLRRDEGAFVRRYIDKRKIGAKAAETFGLGYTGRGESALYRHLKRAYGYELAVGTGLFDQKDESSGWRDMLRNRLTFPIHDNIGRIVGFAGRILEERNDYARGRPGKYVNSADSPHFHKGELLYALHLATQPIRREKFAIVVEGYTDVILLHQAGMENTVGTCGTAFTSAQAQSLSRLCRKIAIFSDGDEAGYKAAKKWALIALQEGLEPVVVETPKGLDPAQMIVDLGAKAVRAVVGNALSAIDWLIRQYDLDESGSSTKLFEEAKPYIEAASDFGGKTEYIRKVARAMGVSIDELRLNLGIRQPGSKSVEEISALIEGLDPENMTPAQIEEACEPILVALGHLQQRLTVDRLIKSLLAKTGFSDSSVRAEMKRLASDAISKHRTKQSREKDDSEWWHTQGDLGDDHFQASEVGIVSITPKSGLQLVSEVVVRTDRELRMPIEAKEEGEVGPLEVELQMYCRGRVHRSNIPGRDWLNDAALRAAISGTVGTAAVDGRRGLNAIRCINAAIRQTHAPLVQQMHFPGLNVAKKIFRTPDCDLTLDGLVERDDDDDPVDWWIGKLERYDESDLRAAAREWIGLWPELFPSPEAAVILLGVTLVGPYLPELLEERGPRMIVTVLGHTGKGKTETAKLCERFWGRPILAYDTSQHSSWKAHYERMCRCRHTIGVIDDLRSGHDCEQLVSLMYDSGKRETLTRAGRLAERSAFRGACIITGESLEGAGESTVNRTVPLTWWPPAGAIERMSVAQQAWRKLRSASTEPSVITCEVIKDCLGMIGALRDPLKIVYNDIVGAEGSSRGKEIAARVALCTQIVKRTLMRIDGVEDLIKDWWPSHNRVANYVLHNHHTAEREASPADHFLDVFSQALASGTTLKIVYAMWSNARTIVEKSGQDPLRANQIPVWVVLDSAKFDDNPCGHYIFSPTLILDSMRVPYAQRTLGEQLESREMLLWFKGQKDGAARSVQIKIGREGMNTPETARVWILKRVGDVEEMEELRRPERRGRDGRAAAAGEVTEDALDIF